MPRTRKESEDQVDLDGDNDHEENAELADVADMEKHSDGDEGMNDFKTEEEDKKKHAELLALPSHESVVYLGGIPHDASKEDLRRFCESIGEVTEVSIRRWENSKGPHGYAFVTFRSEELATSAIEKLNNSELKGKKIKCSTSQIENKLFIGDVPRNWGEEDMKKVVTEVGPGVICIELLKDPMNPSQNRGFGFIEYNNHACAEYSRQKMLKPTFKLDSNAPIVSWADPRNAESPATTQVKSLYVNNLPKDITQDRLKKLFEHHGNITKVVIPPAKVGKEDSRFGFVYFAESSTAMKALKNTEKYEIDGRVLDCSFARTKADQNTSGGSGSQKSTLNSSFPTSLGAYDGIGGAAGFAENSSGGSGSQKSTLNSSFPAPLGYGLAWGAYGGIGTGFGAAGFAQPMIYGRCPTPTGMAMMPMPMPMPLHDGRIGYVLQRQQPGMQPQTQIPPPQPRSSWGGGRSSNSSRGGRRSNSDNSQGQTEMQPQTQIPPPQPRSSRGGGSGSNSLRRGRRSNSDNSQGWSQYNPY